MSFNVETIPYFDKRAKKLAKKFPSLKKELASLLETLSKNPETGTPLGNNCYKIRLSIASKGKGKSGGARIITHVYFVKSTVFLLDIYDKSEKGTISEKELQERIKQISP